MEQYIDWPAFDLGGFSDKRWCFYLNCFVKFCQHIPAASGVGASIRRFLAERRVVHDMYDYLGRVHIEVASAGTKGRALKKQKTNNASSSTTSTTTTSTTITTTLSTTATTSESSDEAKDKGAPVPLDAPALPLLLAALSGLVRGHAPSKQLALEVGVVATLHRLEGLSHKVGPLAEELLEVSLTFYFLIR
jgi:hypothetical protein